MFLLIMLYIWWLRMGHQSWALAIFGLILLSHYWHGESPRDLGFRWANFRDCFEVFSPALLFTGLLLVAAGMLFATYAAARPGAGRDRHSFPIAAGDCSSSTC